MSSSDKLHVEPTPMGWTAYFDPEGLSGHGKDRAAALEDLLDQTDEAWRKALDERSTARKELAEAQRRLSEGMRSLSDQEAVDVVDSLSRIAVALGLPEDSEVDIAEAAIARIHYAEKSGAVLKDLADAAEDFAGSDPDMPSHRASEQAFDRALRLARVHLSKNTPPAMGEGDKGSQLSAPSGPRPDLPPPSPSPLDALRGLVGLIQLVADRDDMPAIIRRTMEDNHRYRAALAVLDDAPTSPLGVGNAKP